MAVYLLHFSRPLHHARHYLGGTADLPARLEAHRTGRSDVKILRAAQAEGITFELARVWDDGGFAFERKLKRWQRNRALCPICNIRPANPRVVKDTKRRHTTPNDQ